MAKEKPDLVYGTLDMLILKALQHDPRHGLAIADRIQQMSKDILHVEQGSLYPALYRLGRPFNFSDIRHRFVRNRMGNRYLTVAVEFCHA